MDVERAGREVEAASREAARHPWVHRLARAGYVARAAVYVVIGALALAVAAGRGGRTTDTKGAIAEVADAPFGQALVLALAIGLAGLALWRLVEAVADPDGTSGKHRLARRIGRAVLAVVYGGLALTAVRVFQGGGAPSGNASARGWTARALDLPLGMALVIVAGAIFVGVGVRQIRRGWKRKFLDHLDLARANPGTRRFVERAGRLGLVAQGTVFGLVGAFLVQAAVTHDPGEATGFDGALAVIARQPFGAVLLGAVAIGLLLFAAYSAAEGAYRRFGTA